MSYTQSLISLLSMKLKFYFSGIILFFFLHGSLQSFCQKIDSATAAAFVPKDLKTDNKILLVKINETERKKIKEFEKQFEKNYTGLFQIVPYYISVDESYPDVKLYKYVLVIGSALSKQDFTGISNKELFFFLKDSSFTKRGSALFIFDRSSNHDLYESGINTIKKTYKNSYEMPDLLSNNSSRPYKTPILYSTYSVEEKTNFKLLKEYIKLLNDY